MPATSEDMLDNGLVNQISTDLQSLISKLDIRNMVSFLKEHAQNNPKQLEAAITNNEMILPCIIELRNLYSRKDEVFYELCLPFQEEDTERSEHYVQWLPVEMVNDVLALLSDKRILLHLLIENGLAENIKKNVKTCDSEGNTALHAAIERNTDPFIVEMLIQYGAIVDIQNAMGETPLDMAIRYKKDSSIICLLLEKSASVSKWPTLYYAIDHGDAMLLQLLLKKGANVNVKDLFRDTPLHLAIYRSNKEITEILLQNRADVTVKDLCGDTPLHLAIRGNNEEIAEILLNNGADVNTQNNDGKTPLDYAREYGDQKLIALFEAYANEQHGNEEPPSRSSQLNPYAFHNSANGRQTAAANPPDSPSNSSRSLI